MPVLRYFVFVGGALLALLFGFNLVQPRPAGVHPTVVASGDDLPPIRIHSDRKLPERVVLDTSQPTIQPPAAKMAAVAASKAPVQTASSQAPADMSAKDSAGQTVAQSVPTEPTRAAAKKTKLQPKRRVARTRWWGPPPWGRPMVLAQQPRFGFFNMTW